MESDQIPAIASLEDEDVLRKERVTKQLFLNEYIVNKGYSKEKFAIFANNEKDCNGNIDHWTFEELNSLVEKFKSLYEPDSITEIEVINLDENYKTADFAEEICNNSTNQIVIPRLNCKESNLENKDAEFENIEIINLSPSNKENFNFFGEQTTENK